MKQSKGKIFLSNERGLNELEWFQSKNTFNFGKYVNDSKQPFGDLYVLNEDFLAGGRSIKMIADGSFYVIILPVIGAISYSDNKKNENLVAAGQALLMQSTGDLSYQIENPFKSDVVSFLQIWIKAENINKLISPAIMTYSNVNENTNQLVDIFTSEKQTSALPFLISIGKFSGRGDLTHSLKKKNTGVFLFALTGAFEIEGRLLHAGDGLALWDLHEIEIEALSNDAFILLIELPFSPD